MNKAYKWLALLLVFALLAGCGDAGSYVKDNYSLIDVQGQGKSTAKVYVVEGKDVPSVAKELAQQEKPSEISKESLDNMFLVYDNKIVNVQKDPSNEANTLVELDSIEYAKQNYDSSFLQGYLTASILQSVLGGGWFNSSRGYDYRGYTSSKRYDDYGKYQAAPYPAGSSGTKSPAQSQQPTTSDRKGSFTTTPPKSGSASTAPPAASGSTSTTTPKSGSSVTTPPKSSSSSSSSSNIRRNDGSKPTYKAPTSSKPSTSSRSGSFKRK